jgi:hypothetical protein
MADIGEAFNTLKFQKKAFQTIDYFFSQRTLTEEQEFIDKNMNRKFKKVKITNNFLALNIPTILNVNPNTGQTEDKPLGFDIDIYGDEGYHYKGTITSYMGVIPNFMIPIKGDKKLFVNINYNFTDSNNLSSTKKFVNFIEVPKRFQNIIEKISDLNTKDTNSEVENIDL